MATRNRTLSKLAKDVDTSGNIKATGISADVSLGLDVYDSFSLLPMVGNDAGDQAFVTDTGRLYVHSGGGWYNTALINRTPTVASIQDSDANTTPFTLASDGTATRITITATDSDGDPLTYNATADSDFAGLATLSQDTNVFTVSPLSQDSATTTSGTITFTITDGINTATPAAQTFTLTFLSSLWKDVNLSIGTSSTNSLANSTFIDRSTNAHTVTPTGSPTQTAFHPYLDNWSVDFPNGTTTYLSIDGNGVDLLGSSDFTVEAWFYITNDFATTNTRGIMSQYPSSGASGSNWIFGARENVLRIFATPTTTFAGSTTLQKNRWYHFAWTRSGSTNSVWLDGTLEGTFTNNADYSGLTASADQFEIGTWGGGAENTWNGYISNARIVKGTAIYSSSFTPSLENLQNISGTVVLACQSNRFVDVSENYTLTAEGASGEIKVSAFNPFGQESEYAAGENKGSVLANSGYMSTSISSIGTGDFTLECWAYFTATPGSGDIIFDSRPDGLSTTGFAFYRRNTGHFTIFHGLGYEGSIDLNANQWYHLAVSRSSGTLKTFVNGVEDTSQSITSNMSRTSATVLAQYDGSNKVVGYVSDLNLTNGTGKYTTDFTPPTAPVGNTSANLYLPMDNAGIFDKTGNNILTLAGNTQTSTTQTKFADTAMYFDGTGDAIATTGYLGDAISLGDYTLEFWFYAPSFASDLGLVGNRKTSFGSSGWQLTTSGSSISFFPAGYGVSSITSSSGTATNTWHHIALVNNSNTITLYLNGSSVGSRSVSSYTPSNEQLQIGRRHSSDTSVMMNGYIENLQVLKGVAKYTSNFTVPNQEQGRLYQAED